MRIEGLGLQATTLVECLVAAVARMLGMLVARSCRGWNWGRVGFVDLTCCLCRRVGWCTLKEFAPIPT